MSSTAERRRFQPLAAAFLISCLTLAAASAPAGEPPFRDDRSDPAAIVASLYDALGRREYARAWSYFGDDKPVADYPAFVAGYADTARVELRLGPVTTEGAAGSTRVFAGCYTTRQLQPAAQEPPFRPLEIVEGKLSPTEAALDTALPTACPTP